MLVYAPALNSVPLRAVEHLGGGGLQIGWRARDIPLVTNKPACVLREVELLPLLVCMHIMLSRSGPAEVRLPSVRVCAAARNLK